MPMFTRNATHPQPVITGALVYSAAFCLLIALSATTSGAGAQTALATPLLAQSSPKLSNSNALAKNSYAPKRTSKPAWQDLTPAQKASLMPLAANWNALKESQKRKWIAIAANYPSMEPREQAKLHNRMTDWVALSQQQRALARLNFAQAKQLDPTQKTANWQAYQALSSEEKQKLAISAVLKPSGAAVATKPVPPQKLTTVPMTRQITQQTPSIAAADSVLDQHTLLPRPHGSLATADPQTNSTLPVLPE